VIAQAMILLIYFGCDSPYDDDSQEQNENRSMNMYIYRCHVNVNDMVQIVCNGPEEDQIWPEDIYATCRAHLTEAKCAHELNPQLININYNGWFDKQ
jgi:hypothetical protein